MKWNDNTNVRVRHDGPSPRPRLRLGGAVAALASLAVALPAAAHPGHPDGGFTAGLLHPLTGLDHLFALLAVGLWSRQQRHGAVLPPAFLVMMALGASCAGAGLVLPALETTGTFKTRKIDLIADGYDPGKIKGPLFFHDPKKGYVRITKSVFEKISMGAVKL